ncbi:MAG: hypothetical protein GEU86_22690 [Actinophytocola sp.]|nr:hypothetical protein [Actinophytocola sp.]
MRFQLLGQLAIWGGRDKLAIPGGKQRALLAFLLVSHGHPVSAERIIDELWGDQAPSKARNALQAKVSSLRGALAPGAPDRGRCGCAAAGRRDPRDRPRRSAAGGMPLARCARARHTDRQVVGGRR